MRFLIRSSKLSEEKLAATGARSTASTLAQPSRRCLTIDIGVAAMLGGLRAAAEQRYSCDADLQLSQRMKDIPLRDAQCAFPHRLANGKRQTPASAVGHRFTQDGRLSLWLHQLDPIAKGVVNIKPFVAFKRLVPRHVITSALEVRRQFAQTVYDEGGMRLPGWYEVVLQAKVDLQRSALEPASSTVGEVCWLGDFWNA
jgi:hypothetical protein